MSQVVQVATAVSLIAGLLAIFGWITGVFSLPQWIQSRRERREVAGPTRPNPDPTSNRAFPLSGIVGLYLVVVFLLDFCFPGHPAFYWLFHGARLGLLHFALPGAIFFLLGQLTGQMPLAFAAVGLWCEVLFVDGERLTGSVLLSLGLALIVGMVGVGSASLVLGSQVTRTNSARKRALVGSLNLFILFTCLASLLLGPHLRTRELDGTDGVVLDSMRITVVHLFQLAALALGVFLWGVFRRLRSRLTLLSTSIELAVAVGASWWRSAVVLAVAGGGLLAMQAALKAAELGAEARPVFHWLLAALVFAEILAHGASSGALLFAVLGGTLHQAIQGSTDAIWGHAGLAAASIVVVGLLPIRDAWLGVVTDMRVK